METAHLKKEERKQILGQCKECGKNLRRDSIKRHMRLVHKETKECEDKTEIHEFLSKSLLIIVECPDCGKSMTKKNLRRHKETSHLKKEDREQILCQCKECGKNMLRDSIKRHMRTVHKETTECEDKTEIAECISKN